MATDNHVYRLAARDDLADRVPVWADVILDAGCSRGGFCGNMLRDGLA